MKQLIIFALLTTATINVVVGQAPVTFTQYLYLNPNARTLVNNGEINYLLSTHKVQARINGITQNLATESFVTSSIGSYVVGPSSSTDNELPVFDGTTGKLIKSNSGIFSTSGGGLFTVANNMTLTADGNMIMSATDDFIFSTADEFGMFAARNRISGAYVLEGVISPTTLTVNTNDYAPTNGNISSTFRISSTGVIDLTGISISQIAGQQVLLINIGANNIVLKNNVTSTADNRFLFGADFTLLP